MIIAFDSVNEAIELLKDIDSNKKPLLLIDIERLKRLWDYCVSDKFEATYISIEFFNYEMYDIIDRMFEENVFHRIKKVTRYYGEVRAYKRPYLDIYGQEYIVLTTPY